MSFINKIKLIVKSKVFSNSAAIVISRAAQMIISFIISIFSAKFLGPSNFGLISYAGSIVTFLIPIANLGLVNIMTYECIKHPEKEGTIVGTSVYMQLLSAFVCVLGGTLVALLLNWGETVTVVVVFLYSLELVFKSLEILEYWFQAHYIAKYSAISGVIAYTIVSIYKLVLLIVGADVRWFAAAMALDYLLIALLYYIFYKKKGGESFAFSKQEAKRLFTNGKSFIVSGLMVAVYLQTDRIMLKEMIDSAEVAFYSVAATLASVWGTVLGALISSSTPLLAEMQKDNNPNYEKAIIGRFSFVFYSSSIIAVFFTLLSPLIIGIIYGESYAPAALVLQILGWGTAFTYLGVSKNIWFITENKQKYIKWLSLIGAITNIILNYFFIKIMGAAGAAAATVITEIIVNFISGFFIKPIRNSSIMMLKSFNPVSLKFFGLLFK